MARVDQAGLARRSLPRVSQGSNARSDSGSSWRDCLQGLQGFGIALLNQKVSGQREKASEPSGQAPPPPQKADPVRYGGVRDPDRPVPAPEGIRGPDPAGAPERGVGVGGIRRGRGVEGVGVASGAGSGSDWRFTTLGISPLTRERAPRAQRETRRRAASLSSSPPRLWNMG